MEKDSYQQVSGPKYKCLLFDVDDTLYSFSSGISSEITKNITEYMITKLGIGEGNVAELCVQLYQDYGTTMAGLRAIGYDFDYDDYHSFVHGRLPYEILEPDPVLRSLLQSLPIRKVIFSNANEAHVDKVVSRLGLEDCFEEMICFETLNPTHNSSSVPTEDDVSETPKTSVICKPFAEAFEKALKIADINPDETLFFDDSIRNLKTAKNMGLHTVRVGSCHRTNGVDYALESIHNVREALPELWETIERSDVGHSGKVAIETSVRA